MLLLALDTSSPRGSIAVAKQNKNSPLQLLAKHDWQRQKSHSELVTVTLQSALADADVSLDQIDAVLVGTGPGSFTGIRVGVALARALGFSLNRPVWSVNSLRLWAQSELQQNQPTLVVVNGFRDIVYVAVYQKNKSSRSVQEVLPPTALQASRLAEHLPPGPLSVVGDGWELFKDQWPSSLLERAQFSKISYPQAHHLFEIFVESAPDLTTCLWKSVKPLYIRGSEAEEKLRQGILKPLSKV